MILLQIYMQKFIYNIITLHDTILLSQEVSSVSSEDKIEDEAEKQPINEGETAAETTTLKLP